MARTKIPKENKVRAILQQEINSVCPFCDNSDVGHFQIHHIDENPSNNEIINLLLVCPTCHSKITKGDISEEVVKHKKEELMKNNNDNPKSSGARIYNINSPFKESVLGDVENLYMNPKTVNRPIVQPTEIHITQEQASVIKKLVDDIIDINDKAGKYRTTEQKSKAYQSYWSSFKKKFNVTSYHLLPKEKYVLAETWLRKQVAMNRPKLRKTNNEEWKKEFYTSIYARIKSLSITKDELYNIAFQKLDLKEPISSLKELTDINLKKLYQIIYSK
jgi:hypothetical protein